MAWRDSPISCSTGRRQWRPRDGASVDRRSQSAVRIQLAVTSYSFRKVGKSQTRRELIVPFGDTGYVVLYEIASASSVLVLAVRHQREEDDH